MGLARDDNTEGKMERGFFVVYDPNAKHMTSI